MSIKYTTEDNINDALAYLKYIDATSYAIINHKLGYKPLSQTPPIFSKSGYGTLSQTPPAHTLADENGNVFLCIFISGDTIFIVLPGIGTNKAQAFDCVELCFIPQSYYGIKCSVSYDLQRFNDELHESLREICLCNPDLTNITIIGHSYGAVDALNLGLMYEHIIAYFKGNYAAKTDDQSLIKTFAESIYESYFSDEMISDIQSKISEEDDKLYFQAISTDLSNQGITSPTREEIMKSIMSLDSTIFSKISINRIWTFAPPDSFDQGTRDYYNNFVESPGDLSLYDKTYNFYLSNDLVCGLFSTRTLLGKAISILFGDGKKKHQVGQVVYLPNNPWILSHFCVVYHGYLLSNQGTKYEIYPAELAPKFSFPILRTIGAVSMIYSTNGLLGVVGVVIGYFGFLCIIAPSITLVFKITWFIIRTLCWNDALSSETLMSPIDW